MGAGMIDTFSIGGDLEVKRLGYGAMRLTGEGVWGPPMDREGAIRLLRHIVESGVNFIDTADSYGPDVSEEMIAEALYPYADNLVIATKGGLTRPGPNRWIPDCRPERIRECCENSLKRLKLDRIDLYQLHRIDPKVPFEDQMGMLETLKSEGKIRHVGLSEVTVDEIQRAGKQVKIATVQNEFNLSTRKSEAVLDHCGQAGIGFIPWYPLAAGKLTTVDQRLNEIASRTNTTPSQVALAWLLDRSPVMLPIPGTSSIAHFDENMGALEINLSDDDFEALSEAA